MYKGPFYCPTCECNLNDSSSYLDHINGSRHNRILGISLQTGDSSVEEVKDMLYKKKKERNDKHAA